MSRLTSLVMLVCFGATARADEPMPVPKPPPTELEGTWRESVPPGSNEELTVTMTLAWESATIRLHGQTLRGSFSCFHGKQFSTISFDVKTPAGTRLVISGNYLLEKDTLSLKIGPERIITPPEDRVGGAVVRDEIRRPGLRRAPLVLMFEKAKK